MSISKEEDEEAIDHALIDGATAGREFPEDIMDRILTFLPGKSIHRFKVVSKRWLNLFSDPKFMKMYKGMFSIDPNNESVFFVRPTAIDNAADDDERTITSVYLINPDNEDNEEKLEPSIVPLPLSKYGSYSGRVDSFACCHGLICMAYHDLHSTIALWNPATEWYKIVSNESHVVEYGQFVSLGLGYDARGDDFKVVRIVCMTDLEDETSTRVHLAEVYSLNSDTWTTIGVHLRFGVDRDNKLMNVNGNPYWYVDNGNDDCEKLVYFDVQSLDFKNVPLPIHFHSEGLRLVDWKGTLGTLQCSQCEENNCTRIEVCVFDDSEKTWRRKHKFRPIRGIIYSVQPFKNGNLLVYKDGKWCVVYTEERRVKEIMIRADDRYGSYSFEIFRYTAMWKEVKVEE